VFTASSISYSLSTSLLVSLYNSLSSNTYHIYLYIFLHLLLFLATSNFSSSILLSSIFLYTNSLFICYLSPLNILTPIFFISSTTLTIFLFFSLAIFIFSIISTSSPSIAKLWIHCFSINVWFFLFFSIPTY